MNQFYTVREVGSLNPSPYFFFYCIYLLLIQLVEYNHNQFQIILVAEYRFMTQTFNTLMRWRIPCHLVRVFVFANVPFKVSFA